MTDVNVRIASQTPANLGANPYRLETGRDLPRDIKEQLIRMAVDVGYIDRLTASTQAAADFTSPGTSFRNLETALKNNPAFLDAAERLLGGRLELGATDGRIVFTSFPPGGAGSGAGGMTSPGAVMSGQVAQGDGRAAPVVIRPPSSTVPNAGTVLHEIAQDATRSIEQATAHAPADEDFSFLSDPSMSVESKLLLFVSKLAKTLDRRIEGMMESARDKARQLDEKKKSSAGVGDFMSSVASGVGSLVGGSVGGALGGMAGSLLGSIAGVSSSSGGTNELNTDMQNLQAQAQQLLQLKQQLYATLTNVLQNQHQSSMSIVNNLRG